MSQESRTGVPKKLFSEIRSRKKKPEGNKLVGEASPIFWCKAEGQMEKD